MVWRRYYKRKKLLVTEEIKPNGIGKKAKESVHYEFFFEI